MEAQATFAIHEMNYAEISHIHGELVHFCIISHANIQKSARKLCIKTYVQSWLCWVTLIQSPSGFKTGAGGCIRVQFVLVY